MYGEEYHNQEGDKEYETVSFLEPRLVEPPCEGLAIVSNHTQKGGVVKGAWKKAVALAVALSVAAAPVLAQRGDVSEGIRKGEMDGRRDTNTLLWMGAGFFFGIFGVGAAYVLEPDPPYGRTAGKSDEYRAAYVESYQIAGKNAQTSAAIKGCVGGTLLWVAWSCCWWWLWW